MLADYEREESPIRFADLISYKFQFQFSALSFSALISVWLSDLVDDFNESQSVILTEAPKSEYD